MLLPAQQMTTVETKKLTKEEEEEDNKNSDNNEYENMIQLLPKTSRNKARILFHSLKSNLSLDEHGRVKYKDDTVGSPLYDHLKYWTTRIGKEGVLRPLDSDKFINLMVLSSVPKSSVSSDKQHYLIEKEEDYDNQQNDTSNKNWIRLFK